MVAHQCPHLYGHGIFEQGPQKRFAIPVTVKWNYSLAWFPLLTHVQAWIIQAVTKTL